MAILLSYSNLSAQRFAFVIGCKTKQSIYDILNNKTKTLSAGMKGKILSAFPELNEYWLLTGEGPMLRSQGQTQVIHGENNSAVQHGNGNSITQSIGNNDSEIALLREQVKHLESLVQEKEMRIEEKERLIRLYEKMMEGK